MAGVGLRLLAASIGSSVLAWSLFVGIGVAGILVTGIATRRAYDRLQQSGAGVGRARFLAIALGILMFAGAWVVVAACWLIARGWQIARRGFHAV